MATDTIFVKRGKSPSNFWLFVVITITFLALLINILSLHFGKSDVAPFLLFIPVVIAAYWYPSKGPVFAIVIAALYLGIVYFFTLGAFAEMLAESVKCYVLIGVGVVVSSLTSHMRKNEIKYRGIFDNSEAGIGLINFSGFAIAEVNSRFASTFGFTPEDILSKGFSDLWVDPVKREEFFRIVIESGFIDSFEARLFAKDGTYRWVLISAGKLSSDQFVCTTIDITDRKTVEESLLVKDHAISSSINAIAILDLGYNTTYINDSLMRIMEYGHEKDLLGKNIGPFIHSLADYNEIRESIQKNGSWFGETILIKANRTPFSVLLWANLVRDKDQNPLCIMTSFIDISENKEMEIVKRKALEQIEKNIEQFAILGDHIRNPLAVIVGLSSLTSGDVTDKIITQAREIDRIVTQLDMGWIESEKVRDFIKKYYKVGAQEIGGTESAAKRTSVRTKYFPEKRA